MSKSTPDSRPDSMILRPGDLPISVQQRLYNTADQLLGKIVEDVTLPPGQWTVLHPYSFSQASEAIRRALGLQQAIKRLTTEHDLKRFDFWLDKSYNTGTQLIRQHIINGDPVETPDGKISTTKFPWLFLMEDTFLECTAIRGPLNISRVKRLVKFSSQHPD